MNGGRSVRESIRRDVIWGGSFNHVLTVLFVFAPGFSAASEPSPDGSLKDAKAFCRPLPRSAGLSTISGWLSAKSSRTRARYGSSRRIYCSGIGLRPVIRFR